MFPAPWEQPSNHKHSLSCGLDPKRGIPLENTPNIWDNKMKPTTHKLVGGFNHLEKIKILVNGKDYSIYYGK
jgi:hypothetical protein